MNTRKKITPWSLLSYVFLVLMTAIILFPLTLMLSSSFKDEMAIFEYPIKLLPSKPILSNYRQLMEDFPLYVLNSVKVTLTIVIVQIFSAATGGYAFAKLKWPGRDTVFLLYIGSLMIPIHVYIIPQFILIQRIGLYDSHWALVLVSSFTALGTFLMKQFFMTIPDALVEAAKIDGANHRQIFGQIILPLAKPVIATQVILSFRFFWNDFFGPLIYLTSENLKTLPLGLADFASEYYTYYGPQMAASVLAVIPVMIIFLLGQKYIVQGVVSSGIK
ncbi:sugar ABC transporter ATP-binding protein [candidate division KSB3 bacterium]|uniref:Sugar ABC transporter ATP-binding protein n=1 Tax=candidate division KSB3 bacterium TaxID=2044937 RepID=A0A2G6K8L8_9BACT|nr:MAG: sugar ABC transporter ATP-binding protein [candidate division KSB3 bacterium]